MSEYRKVCRDTTAASKAFRAVVEAYRARIIGDAEFLAARALHDAALAKFDRAWHDTRWTHPK